MKEPTIFEPNIKARWFQLVLIMEIDKGPQEASIDLDVGRRDDLHINAQI